ncbi:hypothetical protein A3A71_03670 [Candidatus Berkelbacteria bacterium RIFCSPLOWO2_01_FULL_50_28]|uniref:Uncharacterized protein n=1 Tax=Candidatus Berkelbacteria bacterium RIFCSPLOWO2_01_FULL_50_28 TaxID=1797471 RepID=A0A1F5EA35_9BACT|nr:MAG: hypothetical protein A3F39_00315 [Candidatus Berkelbacteria bacterium RIFCSPHIGHO2_12_FULL_50_11]OGD64248.1 MAG: hypothetical protein A3A71_03670 [Candidatus Berkelbacteria bacterium RIFCSPLOWO2_01_FULL_50_28]
MSEINVEISSSVVALVGAITGISGVVLGLIGLFRDRARIKVVYKSEWEIIGSHPHYKNNTIYSEVRVINKGRRPVTVQKLAARVRHDKGWIIIFDPYWLNNTNRLLNEENTTSNIYWIKDLFDPKDIYYFIVEDTAGRKYKKWLHPWKYFFRSIKIPTQEPKND